MRFKIWLLLGSFAALVLLVSFAFQEKPAATPQPSPTRRQLQESVYQSRSMQSVYPSAPPDVAERYRDYFQQSQRQRRPEWFKNHVLSDVELPADSLGARPLSLVGALGSNQVLQQLLPQLPIQRLPNGFRFRGQNYTATDDLLYLFYPHPKNPTKMLTVLTGNSDEAILDFLHANGRRWRQTGDFLVTQKGRAVLFGFFKDDGAWRPEAAKVHDLHGGEKSVKTTPHFVFVTHGQHFVPAEIESLAESYETNLGKLMRRLAAPTPQLPRLTVHLWDSAEEKGLFTGNTDLRHLEAKRNETHLLWVPELHGDDFFAEANWFILQFLGESKSPALREGLAVAMTDRWRGTGHSGWAARLVQTQNASLLAELFDPEIGPAESELVRQPLLGSFVAFLLQKFGPEEFTKLYHSWPESGVPTLWPQQANWQNLVGEWQEKMRATSPIPLRHAQPPKITSSDFQRGFCYAHEGYQIYNGYLGSQSREALLKLAALQVNAVSVTPFGYLRDANTPAIPGRSGGPNGESDESVVIAKNFAREFRIRAMLKPHIWVGRGWPGDIAMHTPADWKTFFDFYERWMRGYAILAEMYGFDMLCAGVELVRASVGHEPAWRDMIKRLRGLYSGPIVYAANWGQEFENVAFWDAFDAIGLDCYYPLSEKDDPSDDELLVNAKRIAEKIGAVAKKYRLPVLVTEIGFCSTANPWKRPHEDGRRNAVNLETQRRCYKAMIQAFSERNHDWLAGVYWWKWPSTLEDGGPEDSQFTPNDKPAAQIVAKWYKQMARDFTITGQ